MCTVQTLLCVMNGDLSVPVKQLCYLGIYIFSSRSFICSLDYFRGIPTYVITVPERRRRTDRQAAERRTDDILWHNRALRGIAR